MGRGHCIVIRDYACHPVVWEIFCVPMLPPNMRHVIYKSSRHLPQSPFDVCLHIVVQRGAEGCLIIGSVSSWRVAALHSLIQEALLRLSEAVGASLQMVKCVELLVRDELRMRTIFGFTRCCEIFLCCDLDELVLPLNPSCSNTLTEKQHQGAQQCPPEHPPM